MQIPIIALFPLHPIHMLVIKMRRLQITITGQGISRVVLVRRHPSQMHAIEEYVQRGVGPVLQEVRRVP